MTPEDILNAEFPEQALEELHAVLDVFPYTTHAIWAIGNWLKEKGDIKGAKMVDGLAKEFARHEARTSAGTESRRPASAPRVAQVPSRHRGILSDDQVLEAALEIAGGLHKRAVLTDLRQRIGGTRDEQDSAFLRLQKQGRAVLYREDAPTIGAKGRHINSGVLMVAGFPRHLLLVL